MKALLICQVAPGITAEAIISAFPRHKANLDEFVARGEVIGVGPFSDRTGSLGIFKNRDAAEAFARADPFILEGLVGSFEIKEWADQLL